MVKNLDKIIKTNFKTKQSIMKYATIVLAALMMSTTSALQMNQGITLKGNTTTVANSTVKAANETNNATNATKADDYKRPAPSLPNAGVPAQKEMQNGELPVLTNADKPTEQPGYLRQGAKDREQTAEDPNLKKGFGLK